MISCYLIPDEESAKEEARRDIEYGLRGYTNAEVVVKLQGWDATYTKTVAQASLSALKRLVLSDKNITGTCFLLPHVLHSPECISSKRTYI